MDFLRTNVFEKRLRQLQNMILSGKEYIYKGFEKDYIFIIETVTISRSGCGRCNIDYPSLTIQGKMNGMDFRGMMDTYNFYPCHGEDMSQSAIDESDTCILFECMIGEEYDLNDVEDILLDDSWIEKRDFEQEFKD